MGDKRIILKEVKKSFKIWKGKEIVKLLWTILKSWQPSTQGLITLHLRLTTLLNKLQERLPSVLKYPLLEGERIYIKNRSIGLRIHASISLNSCQKCLEGFGGFPTLLWPLSQVQIVKDESDDESEGLGSFQGCLQGVSTLVWAKNNLLQVGTNQMMNQSFLQENRYKGLKKKISEKHLWLK